MDDDFVRLCQEWHRLTKLQKYRIIVILYLSKYQIIKPFFWGITACVFWSLVYGISIWGILFGFFLGYYIALVRLILFKHT